VNQGKSPPGRSANTHHVSHFKRCARCAGEGRTTGQRPVGTVACKRREVKRETPSGGTIKVGGKRRGDRLFLKCRRAHPGQRMRKALKPSSRVCKVRTCPSAKRTL